jgi:hypothetical protein
MRIWLGCARRACRGRRGCAWRAPTGAPTETLPTELRRGGARACYFFVSMSAPDPLETWSFRVDEVAPGHYLALGRGPKGQGPKVTASDAETALGECREAAMKWIAGQVPKGPPEDWKFSYRFRCRLRDGSFKEWDSRKPSPLGLGDVVNWPMGPDGSARPGKGYLWRVTSVEDEGSTLVLEFDRPHSEMWL